MCWRRGHRTRRGRRRDHANLCSISARSPVAHCRVFAHGHGASTCANAGLRMPNSKAHAARFDAQEEERGRVARELHDGISQIWSGCAMLWICAPPLSNGRRCSERPWKRHRQPGTAISEVRRISRDLRPGVLDDLGLGPALKTLTEDFEGAQASTPNLTQSCFATGLMQTPRSHFTGSPKRP